MNEMMRWVSYTTRGSYIKYCTIDGSSKLNHKKFEVAVNTILREKTKSSASDSGAAPMQS